MEDLGTLKEQHREQKLFPQLLQLRCRQEPRSVSDASPSPEHTEIPASLFLPSADPTQGTWGYCGTGEVPRWGRTETQQDTLMETYPLLQHREGGRAACTAP